MLRFKVYNGRGEHIGNVRDSIAAAGLVSGDPGAVVRDGLNGRRIVWREPPHGQSGSPWHVAQSIDQRVKAIAAERAEKYRLAGIA